MSDARIFTPENRLAKILDSLGGGTASELVMEANRRVETLTDAIEAFVAEKLTLILPFADEGDEVLFAECRTIADAARQIAEVAGAAKFGAVGEVCAGIAAMVDGLLTSGVWHGDALRVHISALKLIGGTQQQPPLHAAAIVENLRNLRVQIGLTD